jgi:ATP-dependent helicase/DNAse subunit B
MSNDKYSAVWVSNTAIRNLKCPRAYYLLHLYKDEKTGRKVNIINPQMALGQAVHNALDKISNLKVEERFRIPLTTYYEEAWRKVSGTRGGFKNAEQEEEYKQRGLKMIKRIMNNLGPLLNPALRLNLLDKDFDLPYYWFSEEENIILCGQVDWLEYLPGGDGVHIIDFKTGVNDEKSDSVQLPIYCLLVSNLQQRKVKKVSYWYLERDDKPMEVELPDFENARDMILHLARQIKNLRESGQFHCPKGGCFSCKPLEAIPRGEAKIVGVSGNKDVYVLPEEIAMVEGE